MKTTNQKIRSKLLLEFNAGHSLQGFTVFVFFVLDKEFSDEKMHKPVRLSNTFLAFLEFSKSYSNEKVQMRRIVLDEVEVFKRLEETREKVHRALCDDFNTCLAIEELQDLVNFMNKKFQQVTQFEKEDDFNNEKELNRSYGCVMAVCNYVESILKMFGVNFGKELSQVFFSIIFKVKFKISLDLNKLKIPKN